MNEQEQAAGGERVYERCMCREAADRLRDCFRMPENTRQHLRNSRVEFLKALRTLIDHRIEYLSRTGQQGTKVSVE